MFGTEKVITSHGRRYELATVRDAGSYSNLKATARKARKWGGKGCKVGRIKNTYYVAVYTPVKS